MKARTKDGQSECWWCSEELPPGYVFDDVGHVFCSRPCREASEVSLEQYIEWTGPKSKGDLE